MSRRQHRNSALIAFSVMISMLALLVALTEKTPKQEPKPPCICREGLHPVTYETPTGQQRVCLTLNAYAIQKAEACEFTTEKEQ